MKNKILVFIGIVFLSNTACKSRTDFDSNTYLVSNVNIIPMTEEKILNCMSILIQDGIIMDLGEQGTFPIPSKAKRINGENRYLLPGLMDMHTHVRNKANLNLYLANGITTVRNMNGSSAHLRWKTLISEGKLQGPNLFTASPITTIEANTAWRQVLTEQAVRLAVREYQQSGYDLVKVYELPRALFFALIDESKKFDLAVSGHYPIAGDYKKDSIEFRDVLSSGVRSIEHLEELYALAKLNNGTPDLSSTIRMIKASGITVSTVLTRKLNLNNMIEKRDNFFDSTMTYRILNYVNGPDGLADAKDAVEDMKNYDKATRNARMTDLAALLDFLFQLHQAGVNIVPGTDSHSFRVLGGFSLHDELSLYVKAGLSPYEAIRTATINSSKLLNISGQVGSIEKGKKAEFILLDGNPLKDLSTLKKLKGLMLHGKWYNEEDIKDMIETL